MVAVYRATAFTVHAHQNASFQTHTFKPTTRTSRPAYESWDPRAARTKKLACHCMGFPCYAEIIAIL